MKGYSLDLFQRLENTTAEKAVEDFLKQRDKILSLSEKDTMRSAAFYAAFKRLTDEFAETVKGKQFPEMTEYLWGYDVCYDCDSVELTLTKYTESTYFDDEEKKEYPSYETDEYYVLVKVESRLLSIDEYAQNYGVDPKTVTQWIRRGKIRTAKKIGNTWMIPEATDTPSRGYTPARYLLGADMRPLTDEYSFLTGAESLHIGQDGEDKTKFVINCYKAQDGTEEAMHPIHTEVLSQKEKEKFELALISHPKVRYVPNIFDSILIDYMRACRMHEEEGGAADGN